jgi:hypothetical protein
MLIIAVLVAIMTIPLTYQLDPDFGWHLFLGRQMQATGSLTHSLVGYNYFADRQLIDHQWLSHYFLNLIYGHLGYGALIILCAAIILATCAFLYRDCRRQEIPRQYAVLFVLLFLTGVKLVYGVRLQLLLLLGVAALMWIGKYVNKMWWRRVFYFLLFCVGNNMHGGFIILLLIPAFLELNSIVSVPRGGRREALGNYLITMAMAVCGLFLNPYGLGLLSLTWDYLIDPYYKAHIGEWRPLFSFPISGESVVLPTVAIAFFISLKQFWRRIAWPELFLLFVFGVLGFIHIRFFPIFLLMSVPYASKSANNEFPVFSRNKVTSRLVIGGILFLWVLGTLKGISYKDVQWPPTMESAPDYPHGAMQLVSAEPLKCQGAFLEPYSWGGYVLGFYPGAKVFVDGRGPQLKISQAATLLQEANSFYVKDFSAVRSKLRQYSIGCVLVQKPADLSENSTTFAVRKLINIPHLKPVNYLHEYLSHSSNWKQVYGDDESALYERVGIGY